MIARDPVGNPTQVDRTGSLVQTQTYSYDLADRVATVCFAASCTPSSPNRVAWTYDLVGNRLTETRSTGTTNYSYNAGDQLLTAGATGYSYDANGNQLSAGSQTMSWDLINRLKTHVAGNTTTTYSYDGDGKRLQASTGSQASKKTNFLWDVNHGLPQLALERDGNNALQRQYIYGNQRIRQTAGTPSYYHYDGLSSVTNLTSSSGATQWTWSYEPYGSIRTETKASGNQPSQWLKFTGEYLDPTGLYHLRARQYDPASGRFLTLDPVERPTMIATSRYVYADDQPTVAADPSGATAKPIQPSGGGKATAAFASSGTGRIPNDSLSHAAAIWATFNSVRTSRPGQRVTVEWQNPVPGGGRSGGTGYADVVASTPTGGKEIWEVKPDNKSAIAYGRRQVRRYVNAYVASGVPAVAGGWIHPGMASFTALSGRPAAVFVRSPAFSPQGVVAYTAWDWPRIPGSLPVGAPVRESVPAPEGGWLNWRTVAIGVGVAVIVGGVIVATGGSGGVIVVAAAV